MKTTSLSHSIEEAIHAMKNCSDVSKHPDWEVHIFNLQKMLEREKKIEDKKLVVLPRDPTPKMLGAMRKASITRHSDMYHAAINQFYNET